MSKQILFIGGSSYSGSTMLDMMLSNSAKGFSVGEVHALFRPFRPHHFKPVCGCGNADCVIWEQIRDEGEEQLYQTVFDKFKNVEYIVDSSKDPFWIEKQSHRLSKQGFKVHHILIWKNPVDFFASMLKRNRTGAMKAWINYYRLYLSLIGHFIPVSYTELATNSSQSLLEICKKSGIDFQLDMQNYWKKKHHTLFGNDSAKIHLFNSSDELVIEDNKHSSVTDNNKKIDIKEKHQSIYYHKDNQHITKELTGKIENDAMISEIITSLNTGIIKKGSTISPCQYKPLQLSYIKLKSNIKRWIGYTMGKYIRLF